jgi:hypothetical protein
MRRVWLKDLGHGSPQCTDVKDMRKVNTSLHAPEEKMEVKLSAGLGEDARAYHGVFFSMIMFAL